MFCFLETEHVGRDGTTIPIELSSRIIEYRGKPAVLSIARDIGRRKRTEKSLEEMNKRLADVLDNIGDGFITLDNELVVTCFNGAAERLLGRKTEEVLGGKLFEAFPEARGSIYEEKYTSALKNREAVTFETCFDAQPYKNWYEVRVYPYKDGIAEYFTLIAEREERFRRIMRILPSSIP